MSKLLGLVDRGSRDHYRDADLYDHEYRRRRDDVRAYRALAQRLLGGPGRILELGCGTGRVTLPLLRDGHEVVALDGAPAMLARLDRRLTQAGAVVRARCRPVVGDLRMFDFRAGFARGKPSSSFGRLRAQARFPLVIAAFNVVEHLYTRVELAACLRRVAAHLAPGGRFVFDVQVPDPAWLARDPRRRWARTRFTHPRTGAKLVYSTSHDYDPIAQIALIRLHYERADGNGPTRTVHLSQRKFFPAELEALVAASGFDVVERYGDFSFRPLVGGAESQLLVCTRRRRKT